MNRAKCLVLILLFATILPSSCTKGYQAYSTKYPVNFYYNTAYSPFNTIFSFGQFITVRCTATEVIVTSSSDGETVKYPLTESEKRSFVMGLGGLIIGTPTLNNENYSVWAFDLSCPICNQAKYRLTVNSLGEAHCSNCDSKFDLNNSGFVISSTSEEARPLYRYRVTLSGGTISVAN